MGGFVGIRARGLAWVVAGSVAIAVGGCAGTGADRSAASLISAMKVAVRDATSMHMAGQLPNGGRPVALDMGVLRSGALTGTITEGGVPLQLIGTSGQVYVKATPAFLRELRASAAVCTIMCGKYVQLSGTQRSELTGSLGMASLIHSLISALPRFTRAGTTTVLGQPAIVLHGADGSTLDVAARGKPYPLRLIAPRGREESVLFSHWDSVATPAAPPASQVINLSQLKAGSS